MVIMLVLNRSGDRKYGNPMIKQVGAKGFFITYMGLRE